MEIVVCREFVRPCRREPAASWFSEQTQREIEADRYPVRLFSGQDIVSILRAGNCITSGMISTDWLKLAIADAPDQVSDGLRPVSIW